jgi:hypothetical protein
MSRARIAKERSVERIGYFDGGSPFCGLATSADLLALTLEWVPAGTSGRCRPGGSEQ